MRATISEVDHEEFRARCRETEWRGVAVMAGGAVWGWGNAEEFSDLVGSRAEVVNLDLTSGVLEPGPHALLVDGLTRAIAKALPAWPRITRRHNDVVLGEWDELTPERTELLQMFKNVYGGHVAGRLTDRYRPDRDGQPRRWAEAVGLHVEFRWGLTWLTYRPQTNGKVERFNRTLLEEWAYVIEYRSEAERVAAYPGWLHTYNHHRGHTSLKGKSPIDRVPNVPGQNT